MTDVGFASGKSYLPKGPSSPCFHRPVERGLEIRIVAKLCERQELNRLPREKLE
ncbi:hypothetical protein [Malikia granosa]|uniref:hypothetical protein n=1 Tax=Malikia granosa TaxID=263067 RepID=UPI001476729B|nr:hypothetical protein [Malikia granosa]